LIWLHSIAPLKPYNKYRFFYHRVKLDMHPHDLIRELREPAKTKIVLMVADGLGGLPIEKGGLTELETAKTPNLDACVADGVCGLSTPVLPGVAPGSGPGHLGLFGYDPLEYRIGRGILEALGINFAVGAKDVAIRGNFCTLGADGTITDRRAGRPTTERCVEIVNKLRTIKVPGVEVFVEPVKEHRFVLVFRGDGLAGNVDDTDPQAVGVKPLKAVAKDKESEKTAAIANEFLAKAVEVLKGDAPTNGATLRGFATYPKIATMQELYGLKSAAIAVYPMYKGLARLVGMDILDAGDTLTTQVERLKAVERLRLLLPALQVHGQHGRGRQLPRQSADDGTVRHVHPGRAGTQAGRTHRHRRPQHAVAVESPQLASGAHAARRRFVPAGRGNDVRRTQLPPRRPRPIRSEVSHDDGNGPRGPLRQIWSVRN
jgi:2,3-bisphosphoglycerate-independent phosphoglycerate mutase